MSSTAGKLSVAEAALAGAPLPGAPEPALVAGVIVEGNPGSMPAPGWWTRTRSRAAGRLSYALGDQVVYSFGNLVVYALVRRHGSDGGFGAFVLTQRTLDVIFQLCNVFLWGPFCFHLPETAEARQALYRGSVLAQQVAVCLLAAVSLWGLSVWASGSAHASYSDVFTPLIWTSIGITFREYTRRMYFAEMRFAEAFWTELATVLLQIAGVEWLALHGQVSVGSTLNVLSWGAILVSLWWVGREWRTIRVSFRACLEDVRSDFALGRWLFGGNMVNLLSLQCNPWILSSLLGVSAAGDYAVCEYPVNVPRVALTSLQNTMAPSMARRLTSDGRRGLHNLVLRFDSMLLVGSAAFVAIAWWGGRGFAQILFRKVPDDSHSVVVLLALNLLALASTMARSYGLTALGRADLTFYVNLAGFAVQAVVAIPLIKMFHLEGAAIALMLGTATSALLRAVVYAREIRRKDIGALPTSAEVQPA